MPSRIVSGLSLLPAYAVQRPVCIHPLCASWSQRLSRTVSGRRLDRAPPRGSLLLRPRGPRSGPGYSVPVRHHLIGPIRPTRGHTAISPQSGLYAMPSLCGSAEATRKWFRAFTAHSFLACRPLRPRGVRHRYPELRCRHWPSPNDHRLGTPDNPAIRSTRATISWLHWFASATACQVARPPVRIRLARPAFGDFYFQAFNGSVFLPVAGYNYNSDWTPLLAGLSPAGMAASLAARSIASWPALADRWPTFAMPRKRTQRQGIGIGRDGP